MTPRDCVCNATGHCHACLGADRRCERPDCRATCADGHACGRPPEVHDGCARLLSEREDGPDQAECEHDRMSDQDVCLDCGLAFFYCPACSAAGGAERDIYHAKPLCGSEAQS